MQEASWEAFSIHTILMLNIYKKIIILHRYKRGISYRKCLMCCKLASLQHFILKLEIVEGNILKRPCWVLWNILLKQLQDNFYVGWELLPVFRCCYFYVEAFHDWPSSSSGEPSFLKVSLTCVSSLFNLRESHWRIDAACKLNSLMSGANSTYALPSLSILYLRKSRISV